MPDENQSKTPAQNPSDSVEQLKPPGKLRALISATRRHLGILVGIGQAAREDREKWAEVDTKARELRASRGILQNIKAAFSNVKHPDAATDASSPQTSGESRNPRRSPERPNGPQRGLAVYSAALEHNERAQAANQSIAMLTVLLRQDAMAGHDQNNSLLRQLGMDAENLEQVLQCIYRMPIDDVSSLVRSKSSSDEMVLRHIFNIDDPKHLTAGEMDTHNLDELNDRTNGFKELMHFTQADQVATLAFYLLKESKTLASLMNELQKDGDAVEKIQTSISEDNRELDEIKKRQFPAKKIDGKWVFDDPAAVDGARKRMQELKQKIRNASIKIRALRAVENLNLAAYQGQRDPIRFDEKRVKAFLEQAGLVQREIPDNIEWEKLLHPDAADYLEILESSRGLLTEPKTELKRKIAAFDPDGSLLRALISHPERPLKELLYLHLFEGQGLVTADDLSDKVEALARIVGENLDSTDTAAGRIFAYLNYHKFTPSSLREVFRDRPNLIPEVEERLKQLKKTGDVEEIAEYEAGIRGLRSFKAVVIDQSHKAAEKDLSQIEWATLRGAPETAGHIAFLEEFRNNDTDSVRNVWLDIDSDGSILGALKDGRKPVDLIIAEHVSGITDTDSLKNKIKETYEAMLTALE